MSDNTAYVRALDKAKSQIEDEMGKRMEEACLVIEREAKKECPVDQGLLRASITHEVRRDGKSMTGIIGSNLEYAPYVHQGTGIYAIDGTGRTTPWGYTVEKGKYKGYHWTHGQKPQPFLTNAVLKTKKQVEKHLGG